MLASSALNVAAAVAVVTAADAAVIAEVIGPAAEDAVAAAGV
jgi:hypothetical protein